MKGKNQFTNPWTKEQLRLIKNNFKKGDKYLHRIIPNHSIGSIKTKRIRMGLLIGKKSPLKGKKRGSPVKWSKEEIELLIKYYPLIGNHKPLFHKSMVQLIPDKSYPTIRYYSEEVIGLKINHQLGTNNKTKRCLDCLVVKPLSEFPKLYHTLTVTIQNKGKENNCLSCKRKVRYEKRKDINYTYLERLRHIIYREGIKLSLGELKKLLNIIFKINGFPEKCFFDDKFCYSPKSYGEFPLEYGHITPFSKGGTITNPNNIIWICRRHNSIMGNRTPKELNEIVKSMLKKI